MDMQILIGLFFLIGGVVFARKGRGGNMSFVGGASMIIGIYLVIRWVIGIL